MTFPEGGGYWYDQVRALQQGSNPKSLLEWSDIIERKANSLTDLNHKVEFKGRIDERGLFTIDIDAASLTSEARLGLLTTIQDCLDLMPPITKEFYAALMEILAS